MAPQVGLEPTSDRLTADSSTTELLWNIVGLSGLEPPTSRLSGVRSNQLSYRPFIWERVMRIELTTSAWKAEVLPLNYTRTFSYNGGGRGIRTPAGFNTPVGFQDRSLQPDLGIPPYVWWSLAGSNR